MNTKQQQATVAVVLYVIGSLCAIIATFLNAGLIAALGISAAFVLFASLVYGILSTEK